ncbi:MAG: LON peptidase substrate-binding domain-containing protein [Chloroflexota bacterium]
MTDDVRELPLFPLNTVLFPSLPLPLHIFEERYRLMIGSCIVTDNLFGVCLIKEGVEVGGPAEPFEIGTVARISEVDRQPDGRMNLMTFGTMRFKLLEITQREPYLVGRVELLKPSDEELPDTLVADVTDRLLRYLREVRRTSRLPDRGELMADVDRLAYLSIATLGIPARDRQTFLETDSTLARLTEARDRLRREIDNARLFGREMDGPSIGPFSRN